MDTNGYEVSEPDDIECFWENHEFEKNAVFRLVIDTIFSPTVFKDLEMEEVGSSKNPIVVKEEEDMENSPLTILVSERPTEPPKLLGIRFFWERSKKSARKRL